MDHGLDRKQRRRAAHHIARLWKRQIADEERRAARAETATVDADEFRATRGRKAGAFLLAVAGAAALVFLLLLR